MSGLYMTLIHGALVPGCRTCKLPLVNMVCTRCGPRVVGMNGQFDESLDLACKGCGYHVCNCMSYIQPIASQPEPGQPSAEDFERARELGWRRGVCEDIDDVWAYNGRLIGLGNYNGGWQLCMDGEFTYRVNFRTAIEWVAYTLSDSPEFSYQDFAYAYARGWRPHERLAGFVKPIDSGGRTRYFCNMPHIRKCGSLPKAIDSCELDAR